MKKIPEDDEYKGDSTRHYFSRMISNNLYKFGNPEPFANPKATLQPYAASIHKKSSTISFFVIYYNNNRN